jgi:hypothetical protein
MILASGIRERILAAAVGDHKRSAKDVGQERRHQEGEQVTVERGPDPKMRARTTALAAPMNLASVVKALTVRVSNSIPRRGGDAGSGSGSCASPIC